MKQKNNPFILNMKQEVNRLINFYWLKQRGYKVSVPLEVFADIFILIKDLPVEDPRKFNLCQVYGLDIYQIKIKASFEDTIRANADWLKIADERYFTPSLWQINYHSTVNWLAKRTKYDLYELF